MFREAIVNIQVDRKRLENRSSYSNNCGKKSQNNLLWKIYHIKQNELLPNNTLCSPSIDMFRPFGDPYRFFEA